MHVHGLFICLEGGEGSGKTTIATAVREYLEGLGRNVMEVSDPGSTPLAQRLREIVVDANIPCTPTQQALIYVTARNALAEEICQHLDLGTDVVSGRWTMSTIIYQGVLGGVGLGKVAVLTENFVNLEPDIYILLNATPEIALARKAAAVGQDAMAANRFDGRSLDWHKNIQQEYYRLALNAGYPIIDADQPLEAVKAAVIAVCQTNPKFREMVAQLTNPAAESVHD